jgi:hypothetical protein
MNVKDPSSEGKLRNDFAGSNVLVRDIYLPLKVLSLLFIRWLRTANRTSVQAFFGVWQLL